MQDISTKTAIEQDIYTLSREVKSLRDMIELVYNKLGIENEWLNAKEIAKELKISIKYLYNPRMRDELRGWGMTKHGRLSMKRCDLRKYMDDRGS